MRVPPNRHSTHLQHIALKSLCTFIAHVAEAGILSGHTGVMGISSMDIVPVTLIFAGMAFSGTNSIINRRERLRQCQVSQHKVTTRGESGATASAMRHRDVPLLRSKDH